MSESVLASPEAAHVAVTGEKGSSGSAAGYSLGNAQDFGWGSISGNLHPERLAHLEKYLIGPKVLDAGCGGGGFVHFLSGHGFEATGVDLFTEFLSVARAQGWRGRFVQADVTRLPFADKTFDTTFCFDVLEHVDDVAAIQELARVTRHRLILAVPKENDVMAQFALTFLHYRDQTHLRYYTEASLAKLCALVKAARVDVFPELSLPSREIALYLLQSDWSGLRSETDQTTKDVPVPPPPFVVPPPLPQMLPPAPAVVAIPPPPLPFLAAHEPGLLGLGLLGRLRRRLAGAPSIRAAYEAAYQRWRESYEEACQAAWSGAYQGYRTACEATLQAYQTSSNVQYEQHRAANEAAYYVYCEGLKKALQARRTDEAFTAAVRRFLDNNAYRNIPTGLVALVDL